MQRWHLTAGLAGAAALAAFVVPSLTGSSATTGEPHPLRRPIAPAAGPSAFDGALTLSADLDKGALLQGQGDDRYLVIEVGAPDLAGDVRRPVDLAVVMDTSGSMAGRGKIDNARMAAAELVGQLGTGDSFSLVTFSDAGRVIVDRSTFDGDAIQDKARLERLIGGIRPGGGTNLSDGLGLGLEQLDQPELEGVRRVVILSDGMANIGITDVDTLARTSGSLVDQGITVSALGLGLDYNEDLLTAMSDAGGGTYRFVDEPGQLASMFAEELQEMTRVAGREVALDVALPEGVVLEEVYGWKASATADGYQVFLGDLHGGETNRIVARISVDADALGEVEIADVALRYTDADTDRTAEELAEVDAEVTRDSALVQRSVNKQAGIAAARAHAGTLLDQSARSYDKGDLADNRDKLRRARSLLEDLSTDYDAPELEEAAEEVARQQVAFDEAKPSSDAGIYQIKKAKEAARGYQGY